MVVIDEASSFKSHSSQRFKALKKILPYVERVVELTATPSTNGYTDIWSQFFLLDGGYRLGRTITFFRNRYFEKDFMGWNYNLRYGAVKDIQDEIQDLVLSMSAEDYLDLPEFIPTVLGNDLTGKLLKQYEEFEKNLMLEVGKEKHLTAMSAATLINKLLQFCSGNVYDENGLVHHFHDLKIDTLKEVIESAPDENLLVAYNYKHELAALREAFPDAVLLDKKGDSVNAWNEGKIKMLLAHPQSASMGLNLQKGGSTIVWYGFTFSLENYLQMNGRLHRQGQRDNVKCIHIAVGNVEYDLMKKLAQKEVSMKELLAVLK